MNVVEYSPRQSQWDYSTIFTEPEANSCFSIMAKVLLNSVLICFESLKYLYWLLDYLYWDKQAFFIYIILYLKYCVGKTLPLFKIYSLGTPHLQSFVIFLAMKFFPWTELITIFHWAVIWGKHSSLSFKLHVYQKFSDWVYKKESYFCLRMFVVWFKSVLSWLSGLFDWT